MENLNDSLNRSVENEESDSGDSLFITQKPIPHPVRSAFSPCPSRRSTPLSSRFHELESSSESDAETVPEKGKTRPCLPKYNFSFLKRRKSQLTDDGSVDIGQNRAIHRSSMAGFFSCVEEIWPSGGRERSFESTLPTVDSHNEEITPITEDEKSDEDDVKIIDKRLFVYSVKPTITKNSQPWFKSLKNKMRANKATPQDNSVTKHKLQSTFNKSIGLANKQQNHLYSSDSDATVIEGFESSASRSKNTNKANNYTFTPESSVNLTEIQQSTNQENDSSTLEESDNNESQSILQYNAVGIRGSSQDIFFNEDGRHQSTKKKLKNKRMEGDNGNWDTSLSQDSIHLFDNLKTSQESKALKKNDMDHLDTKNKDNAEKLHDGECDFENEPTSVNSSPEKEVIHEDTGQPSCSNVENLNHDDATVQKKKKKKHKKKNGDLESADKGTDSLNLDSLQMLGQTDNIAEVEKDTEPMSVKSNTDREENGQSINKDTGQRSCPDVENLNHDDDTVWKKKKKKHKKKTAHLENSDNRTFFSVNSSPEKEVMHEATGQPTCPNVENVNHDDATVRKKKKKKHKKKNGDLESADKGTDSLNLDSLQMLGQTDYIAEVEEVTEPMSVRSNTDREENGQSINEDTGQRSCPNVENLNHDEATVWKKKKKKHKKKTAHLENSDNRTNCSVSSSPEKEVMHEATGQPTCPNVENVNHDDATVWKKKKKKHKKKIRDLESTDKGTDSLNINYLQMLGQTDNIAAVEKDTETMSVRSNTDREENGQSINEDTGQRSCPNVENLNHDDATVWKKKKHKKKTAHLEKSDDRTNCSNVDTLLGDGQTDDITAVDREVSDMSVGKEKKLKKKRKAHSDDCNDEQDVASKKLQLNRTDKNSSSKLVESQENSELVNHDNSASDCVVTQSDESVSARKKKVSSAAKTMENAKLALSTSIQSHGADELGISTNDGESAETNRLLQETELGSSIKKKKKKRRKDDKLDDIDTNGKASGTTEMSRCNESKDLDSTEVGLPHSGDGHVKKRKKSKHENHQPGIEVTAQRKTSEAVQESAMFSPNAPERKNKKCVVVESAVTELEQPNEKRTKNKTKAVDQIISTSSQDEMSTSSGRLETSSRTKVKKRLYNTSSQTLFGEF